MSKRKPSTREYRVDSVRLAIESGNIAQTAKDLGLQPNTLYNWVKRYRSEALASSTGMTVEQELAQLRREVAQLKEERDILKKATAYFAKHQR